MSSWPRSSANASGRTASQRAGSPRSSVDRSADRALAEVDRLARAGGCDEVRARGQDLALSREEAVARALGEQHDRQVALQVGLLVDREEQLAGAHGAQHVGA